ncbi:MAG TPA: hypothetical protein VMW49_08160 [Candidatus Dormibacteraeota bacterium]|nr:hypothetical protein [Candidatus Dormibacteraeota bacterium]
MITNALLGAALVLALGIAILASRHMSRGLTELGTHYGWRPGVIGWLTALGADTPEISSALAAVVAGRGAVGVGVILGANLFGLAAILSLPLLWMGGRALRLDGIDLDVAANLAALAVTAAILTRVVPAPVGFALLLLVVAAYLVMLWRLPQGWPRHRHGPRLLTLDPEIEREEAIDQRLAGAATGSPPPVRRIGAGLLAAVVVVVVASDGAVRAALALADRLHLPAVVVGTFVLAIGTSLPNVAAGFTLLQRGHRSALVSETFNSGTLNLVFGLGLPAAVAGVATGATITALDVPWLAASTVVVVALLASPRGLRRPGAALLVAGYLGYVVVRLAVSGP